MNDGTQITDNDLSFAVAEMINNSASELSLGDQLTKRKLLNPPKVIN